MRVQTQKPSEEATRPAPNGVSTPERKTCARAIAYHEQRAILGPEPVQDVLAELDDVDGRLQPPSAARQLDHGLDQVRGLKEHSLQILKIHIK